MNPIFTITNDNRHRGYWYDDFAHEFDSICQNHLREGRAKSFAFIVYNFHSPTQQTLNIHGVFTELDRLSGKEITIFYLDGNPDERVVTQNRLYQNFNSVLLELTGQSIQSIPFIVFFDFQNGEVTNFECVLIRDDERFILHDLSSAIENRLNTLHKKESKKKPFIKRFIKKTIDETPTLLYGEFIGYLFNGLIKK